MSYFPQDSPNVVYIIVSRNETFGYNTHLIFLVQEKLFLKMLQITSITYFMFSYYEFQVEEIGGSIG